jgi:hypothetical protein
MHAFINSGNPYVDTCRTVWVNTKFSNTELE